MPARQPFTALCQALARPHGADRADLHVHTTYSDGSYRPEEIVDLARRCGLAAVAITDHDTLGGIAPARAAALGTGVEVIAGVEITTEYLGRELHLLAYDIRTDDPALGRALERLATDRVRRFWDMAERLRRCGVDLPEEALRARAAHGTLGRRHLAEMIVAARQATTVRDAFRQYLGDGGRAEVPKLRLPVAEALALVRAAGGVAAWAHPSYDCSEAALRELRAAGLTAVEVDFPSCKASRSRELRALAGSLGLAVTAGSDCHGPGRPAYAVGAHTVSRTELARLREAGGAALWSFVPCSTS